MTYADDWQHLLSLRRRIETLNVNSADLGLDGYLYILEKALAEGDPDYGLAKTLDEGLKQLESGLKIQPFITPAEDSEIHQGDYHVADVVDAEGNDGISLNFLPGKPNQVYHTCVIGNVGSGKSMLMAQLASEASRSCDTFLIDSSRTFRKVSVIRATHRFIRMTDLRLNPWDDVPGVPSNLSDAVVCHLVAKHCSWIYAEYEVNLACEEIRSTTKRAPNPMELLDYLEKKKYPPMSRRANYRDSAVLGLRSTLINMSGDGSIYKCKKGMSVLDLLRGNTVLEMSGLAEAQTFITEFLLIVVELLVYSGVRLKRPLVFFLDETQVLMNSDRNRLVHFCLGCRHLGIHLVFGFQNANNCPPEFLSNCDAFFCFKTVDDRDRQMFRRVANLNGEQSAFLLAWSLGSVWPFSQSPTGSIRCCARRCFLKSVT